MSDIKWSLIDLIYMIADDYLQCDVSELREWDVTDLEAELETCSDVPYWVFSALHEYSGNEQLSDYITDN